MIDRLAMPAHRTSVILVELANDCANSSRSFPSTRRPAVQDFLIRVLLASKCIYSRGSSLRSDVVCQSALNGMRQKVRRNRRPAAA
jgi:hypothetical protein